jgi:hypothetical protein
MTLAEAARHGIRRVRLAKWAYPTAYLKQDLFGEDRGPWVHLYERATQETIGESTPQTFLVMLVDDEDGFTPYDGPLDPADGG